MLRFVCVMAFLMLGVRSDKWPRFWGASEAPAGPTVVEAVSEGRTGEMKQILFGYSAEVIKFLFNYTSYRTN